MADEQKGPVAAGFGLLWRRQGILWWVFVMNFICGALGTIPGALLLNRTLHHTLAGEKLSKSFDVGMFFELIRLPNVNMLRWTTTSYLFAFMFLVFMLFVTGGILETYRQDRRLTTGDFFAASGEYFWRFVRLLLLSIIPFVVACMIYQGVDKASDYFGDKAVADQVGAYISIAGFMLFLLLALCVRLWFDIAQVRAVAQNERRMWRNLWRSWRITAHDFGQLFRMYFCISVVAWVALAVGLFVWAKLPPTATPVTFVLLQLIVFTHLATRLWQLSSATIWYQRHAEMVPADSADYTTPQPEEVVETPAQQLHRRPDAELELPPADA
jgi:hypothetical protein